MSNKEEVFEFKAVNCYDLIDHLDISYQNLMVFRHDLIVAGSDIIRFHIQKLGELNEGKR